MNREQKSSGFLCKRCRDQKKTAVYISNLQFQQSMAEFHFPLCENCVLDGRKAGKGNGSQNQTGEPINEDIALKRAVLDRYLVRFKSCVTRKDLEAEFGCSILDVELDDKLRNLLHLLYEARGVEIELGI